MKHDPDRLKWYGLFGLATIMIVCAGATFYMWPNNFPIRLIGLLFILVSVYLFKKSIIYRRPRFSTSDTEDTHVKAAKRHPSFLMWVVGVVLIVAWGLSFLYLDKDAIDGYHDVLPVYLFTGIGLTCGLFWAYLIAKLIWLRGRR